MKSGKRAVAEPSPIPSQIEANEQPLTHKPTVVDDTMGAPPSKSHRPNSKLQDGPADALDLAIEDMLAVKDLVSYVPNHEYTLAILTEEAFG